MKKEYKAIVRASAMFAILLSLLVSISPGYALDEPYLVKDINETLASSAPANFAVVNNIVYFSATTFESGTELWKSDGTDAGTVLVKDIYAGANSSNPAYLTDVNGMLYFTATNGTNGVELWKSDGTDAGTVMVKDIYWLDSNPSYLTNVNGTLYFAARGIDKGYELWRSDGTDAGTVMVKDIYTGSSSSIPAHLTDVNGTLYFAATNGTNGVELWKSDGTDAGTVMVKDINADASSSNPTELTNVNGMLYFAATDANGIELWKSDGTVAGTVLVKDIRTGSSSGYPSYLTNVNGTLFFRATDGISSGLVDGELWKSDGTAAGTVLVKDINPGASGSTPGYLTNVNGTLYFSAEDLSSGAELWKSDGTAAGTVMVKNINAGGFGSRPSYLTNVNGTLYFTATDGVVGGVWEYGELWKSDGTAAGTVLVKDIYAGTSSSSPSLLTNGNGTLFFKADNGTNGIELWTSDGTDGGTVLVKDIYAGTSSSSPSLLTNAAGTLFFKADNGTNGIELWTSDGTYGGTVPVKDIYAGTSSSNSSSLTNVNGMLYFTATNEANGAELWKSDGTEAGTVMVKDIRAGTSSSAPSQLTNVNATLYFAATDANGTELWKSDGTDAGTVRVKDIYAGTFSSSPSSLTNVNGMLYFTATNEANGAELWKSDGTEAGTVMVKDIRAGTSSSAPSQLTNVNATLYFQAFDGVNGDELWKSDGTDAGTVMVKDIYAGASGSSPANLANVNGTLYFMAYHGTSGLELWKSDGTAAGTVLVKDINPGSNHSIPSNLTSVNGVLYFTADDGTNGTELWKSDGTEAGTVMVKDINPGAGTSNAANLTNVNGVLYFTADDGTNGSELWKSDGTAARTVMVSDVYPGVGSSSPSYLTSVNGILYFSAAASMVGNELWALVTDITPPSTPGTPIDAGNFGLSPVVFSWAASSDGESGVLGYNLQVGTTPGGNDVFDGFVGDVLTYQVAGTHGQTLYARVQAENSDYLVSAWSGNSDGIQIDMTPPSTPGTPTDAGTLSSSTVSFNWTSAQDSESGIAGYNLQVGTTPGGNDAFDGFVGNVVTYQVAGTHGQTLYAGVQAKNGAGSTSGWSTSSDGITVDATAPTVEISAPSVPSTSMGPVSYTVTYTDSNFNSSTLAAADVTLNRTGSANGTVVVEGAGAIRTVSILGITGEGTLGISIAAGTATDLAGNPTPTAGPSGTVDVSQILAPLTGSSFSTPLSFATGTATSLASADFNRDGNADLVVGNFASGLNVSTYLGNGDGTFGPATAYTAGANPFSVAAADFNEDGVADLAVANVSSANISVLLGYSDGTFQTAVNYAAGTTPQYVTAAYLNGDGLLDLAVANYGTNNVSVFLGTGGGSFAPAVNYAAGSRPRSVAAADLNGDGMTDLAVANYGTGGVSVLLNISAGTFGSPVSYSTGADPYSVAAADFNGDGNIDLAVANYSAGNISILLGNGDGTYQAAVNYAAGAGLLSMTAGDVNGDGNADLVATNYTSNTISALLGNGDGSFAARVTYATGTGPRAVIMKDFNGDQKNDLAVASYTGKTVSLFLNNMLRITPSGGPNGNIVCAPAMVDPGGDAVCSVVPYPGFMIDTVSGCGGSLVGNTYTITNVTSDCTVTAIFTVLAYPLNVSVSGSGSVTSSPAGISCGGDCSEAYAHDTVVTLTPAPDISSVFSGWSGDADCSDGTLTMDGNRTCTATFTIKSFTVTASAGANGSVSPASQSVTYGNTANVTVTSNPGYHVASVSGCGGTWTGSNPYTTGPITAACSVTATFVNAAPTVPTLIQPLGGSEVSSITPTLQGSSTDSDGDPILYLYEVSTDSGFGTITASSGGEAGAWVVSTALADNTQYWWRVRATDGLAISADMSPASFFVNTANDAPTAPGVFSPSNGVQLATLTPQLSVTPATDVDKDTMTYEFEVSLSSDFTSTVASAAGITQGFPPFYWCASWTTPALIENTWYYWRSRAVDSHGLAGNWTAAASFFVNTANDAPSVPVLSAPATGSELTSQTQVLTVNSSTDPENDPVTYTFELDTVNTFDSPNKQSIAGTQFLTWTPSLLSDNTTWYWRVKTSDGTAESAWMATASFFVNTANDSPGAATVNYPSSMAEVTVLAPELSVNAAVDPDNDAVTYDYEIYRNIELTVLAASVTGTGTSWTVDPALSDNTWYLWRSRARDSHGAAGPWATATYFFVNYNGYNDPPSITVTSPGASEPIAFGTSYTVRWSDSDPDNDAVVTLGYDTIGQSNNCSGSTIVSGIRENDPANQYPWNITGLAYNTSYWVYAKIDDGINPPVCAYAQSALVKGDPASLMLTVSKAGTGYGAVASTPSGIDCGGDCSEVFGVITPITLTATPAASSVFTGWSGACSGTGSCQVTVDGAKTVTATFALKTYTVTAITDPNGSLDPGTPTPVLVSHGTTTTFIFNADTGYHLASIDGTCGGTAYTPASNTVTTHTYTTGAVTSDCTLFGVFAPDQYVLTATKSGTGSGSITSSPAGIACGTDCSEAYGYNSQITLSASAQAGSSFIGWSGGGCSGTAPCPVTMTAARTVTAQFQFNTPAVSDVTFGADLPSPQMKGASVVFTAQGSGGSGSYEYQFLIKAEGDLAWTTARSYQSTNTWTWTTAGATPGAYTVMVYVRNQGSASAFDMARNVNFSVVDVPPAKAGSFTASSPSPLMSGPTVTFTAQGTGGSGPYEYKFLRKLSTSMTWTTVRDYGANTWAWDTSTAAAGTYTMRVYIRNQGSPATYEAVMSMNYSVVNATPVTGATLTASMPSPLMSGPTVTFTAQGSGGSGTYEYQFLRKYPSSTTWEVVRDYSETNTWAWDTDGVTLGMYAIKVNVRNNGSAALYEVVRSMNYSVTLDEPATDTTLTVSSASPLVSGPTITITASGTGGTGPYEYQFMRKLSTDTVWTVRDYTSDGTWEWNTSGAAPGNYTVRVYVRRLGSVAAYEVVKSLVFTVLPDEYATSTTLDSSPTGSSPAGTPVLFTAAGAGGSNDYEYKFWLKAPSATVWTMVQNYGADTWSWDTTGLTPGKFTVRVYVRHVGSTLAYEALKAVYYMIK